MQHALRRFVRILVGRRLQNREFEGNRKERKGKSFPQRTLRTQSAQRGKNPLALVR
jgi:hypothetical protein